LGSAFQRLSAFCTQQKQRRQNPERVIYTEPNARIGINETR